MARTVNDHLEIEEKDLLPEFELGERPLTAFEKARLEFDPTLPIYIDPATNASLRAAHVAWLSGCRSRSRSVPVTVVARAARPLAEGHE